MTAPIALDVWLTATAEAASDFASMTLDAPLQAIDVNDALPPDLTGCFVALVGEEGSFQVGLASDATGCQTLAKALFASDEDLPEADVSDALGEIANIVAGGVKKRMATVQQPLSLGLPIVMEGHIRITERQQIAQLDVRLGEVPVRLLIVSNREPPFNPRRTH